MFVLPRSNILILLIFLISCDGEKGNMANEAELIQHNDLDVERFVIDDIHIKEVDDYNNEELLNSEVLIQGINESIVNKTSLVETIDTKEFSLDNEFPIDNINESIIIPAILEDDIYSNTGNFRVIVDRDIYNIRTRKVILPSYSRFICSEDKGNKSERMIFCCDLLICNNDVKYNGLKFIISDRKRVWGLDGYEVSNKFISSLSQLTSLYIAEVADNKKITTFNAIKDKKNAKDVLLSNIEKNMSLPIEYMISAGERVNLVRVQ